MTLRNVWPAVWVGLITLATSIVVTGNDASQRHPRAGDKRLPDCFYREPDKAYSIVQSAIDSVRFTLNRCLVPCECGGLRANSSFVDPTGRPMDWHDFGPLEGPGWAANALGGAWEIYRFGGWLNNPSWCRQALAIVDHVLNHGFIREDGFIWPYRNLRTVDFCLNYQGTNEWFCPGSLARVAWQMLLFSRNLPENDARKKRLEQAAVRFAAWLDKHMEPVPNGWFPRRVTPDGRVYPRSPTGGEDPFWQTSADGLFIVLLHTELTRMGLADYRDAIASKVAVFIKHGGIYGSINHDTYDPHENVAYAVAFRTLLRAGSVLQHEGVIEFAFRSLHGLDRFKMCEDRNGVATGGLLYMEDSWDTAYLWENAEAALAYFEAASYVRQHSPRAALRYELDGLTILRACALHHYGPYGFLTEGVDWNNHVGQQHHIGGAEFGAIRYTEPFLNNQHIVEPTLYYLQRLARRVPFGSRQLLVDPDGALLGCQETR